MQTQTSNAIIRYKETRRKAVVLLVVLAALLPVMILFSVGLGAMQITAAETLRIIAGKITGNRAWLGSVSEAAAAVVWELRLPRILCGILTGAALAAAGVIFQAILQNPLADPYTLGVSTGAAFGASLAILLNISFGLAFPVPVLALGFAALTLFLVLAIAQRGPALAGTSLIMAGIIIGAILSAGISFIKMLSGEYIGAIVFWLMGSLSARGWPEVLLLGVVLVITGIPAVIFSEDLNLLTLGERNAGALGLSVKNTRRFYLFLGAALSAVCVSVCGVIGFIGLVVPHLLRFSVSSNNRFLLPLAMCLGALLLSGADTCARLLASGEIPVGVLTTLLGGPFFIYIFLGQNRIRQ